MGGGEINKIQATSECIVFLFWGKVANLSTFSSFVTFF